MAPRSERVTFAGSQGDALAARLELPEGRVKAYAIFAHCFTCSKDIFAASRIAAGLAERGIAVLRFDFTGLGMSKGDFANYDRTPGSTKLLVNGENEGLYSFMIENNADTDDRASIYGYRTRTVRNDGSTEPVFFFKRPKS